MVAVSRPSTVLVDWIQDPDSKILEKIDQGPDSSYGKYQLGSIILYSYLMRSNNN